MVSGGDLKRGLDGSYLVCGKTDNGRRVLFDFEFRFLAAVKYDWKLFQKQYEEKGINSLEELKEYYNQGNFANNT
ncbi:MAG: hypothetical protein RUMPE_00851 [Eubacteriales bacterium SKADARSKE-1]|nr:hypothetical protein [Eubacteriales bacterium SKADARSKE-1]